MPCKRVTTAILNKNGAICLTAANTTGGFDKSFVLPVLIGMESYFYLVGVPFNSKNTILFLASELEVDIFLNAQ